MMQDTAVTDRQEAAQLVRKVGVSQKLVDAAMERMATEECVLGSGPNAWLLYNGALRWYACTWPERTNDRLALLQAK